MIRIRFANLDALATGETLISADELARAERIVDAATRRRFVAARTFLRIVLGEELVYPPERIELAYTPRGKPYLLRPDAHLAFNVSHSDELVVVAATDKQTIGVDIEHVKPVDVDALAPLALHADDVAELTLLRGRQQLFAFYRVWTRREALAKATGGGLSEAPVRLGVDPVGPEGRLVPPDLRLHELSPPPGFVGALVAYEDDRFDGSRRNAPARADRLR